MPTLLTPYITELQNFVKETKFQTSIDIEPETKKTLTTLVVTISAALIVAALISGRKR